jgi:DNA-binding transcriptional LysR family regulator
MALVTSPRHPLASYRGHIPAAELSKHIQLVLTDRSTLSQGRDFNVLSPKTWRLADLGAKHAFLRAGLGWGGMPAERVEADIADGSLTKIAVEDAPLKGFALNMSAIYLTAKPPGPAGRWFVERLKRPLSSTTADRQAKLPRKQPKRRSRQRGSAKRRLKRTGDV